MTAVPFRTFNGFLKQHSHDNLSNLEQELFDLLFPVFQGNNDAEQAYEKLKSNPMVKGLEPFVQCVQGERRPRRYSGYGLPRNRYYAVAEDVSGNDFHTLTHELRAYRDPVDYGMVEVLDLATVCNIKIGSSTISLKPQQAIAVLIHEPQLLPKKFHKLKFKRIPGLKGQDLYIYVFPYQIINRSIERTIDLRYPEVREWFYQTFHTPSSISGSLSLPHGMGLVPTIAYSRFHFDNGTAPTPDNFMSMLPTLLNPDLGGGDPLDTGGTLTMIGHWMRQNDVGGFVFPSARCDSSAVFQHGKLVEWQGWNLIDYREAPLFGFPDAKVFTGILSPWAWVNLPAGVQVLKAGPGDKQFAGTFAIENMVNYWAMDYLAQLQGLEIARDRHGRETPRGQRKNPHEGLSHRAFQIGVLTIRWMRMVVQNKQPDEINQAILELQGLALPYRMYSLTGRSLELWLDVHRSAISLNEALLPSLTTIDLISRFLQNSYPKQDFNKLVGLGADIELILLFLAWSAREKAANKNFAMDPADFAKGSEANAKTACLSKALKKRIGEFLKSAIRLLKNGPSNVSSTISEGELLLKDIYSHLR